MFRRKARIALLALAALALQAATIPRPATDIAIGMRTGKPLHLSQYKGKVVVLAFILTTCSHCQKTTVFLNKLQKELGPRGLQVVASAIEAQAENSITEFAKRFDTPYPVGYNSVMDTLQFMQHPMMKGPSMPYLAFIDRKGVIRAQHEGSEDFFGDMVQEQNLRKEIEPLLKEGQPGAAAPAAKKPAPPAKKGS